MIFLDLHPCLLVNSAETTTLTEAWINAVPVTKAAETGIWWWSYQYCAECEHANSLSIETSWLGWLICHWTTIPSLCAANRGMLGYVSVAPSRWSFMREVWCRDVLFRAHSGNTAGTCCLGYVGACVETTHMWPCAARRDIVCHAWHHCVILSWLICMHSLYSGS